MKSGDRPTVVTRNDRRAESGSALIFALMVLFILSVGTSMLWKQLHGNLAQQRRGWHQEQAFQLAEAGLERAVAELRATQGPYAGQQDVPLGPGFYSITVSPDGSDSSYVLESWGRLENAAYHYDRVRLRARLQVAPDGRILRYSWERIKGEAP